MRLATLFLFGLAACAGSASGPEGDELEGNTLTVPDVLPAQAAELDRDLDATIAEADQIVHGTVTAIDYARSVDLGPDTMVFPFTFVTLRVDTPLLGGDAGDLVTLRFTGGADGKGGAVLSEHVPLFDQGDEVVLFVHDNGERACPLVDCETGLIRISDDRVYTARGVELFLDDAGALRRGNRADIPEASTFHIGELAVDRRPTGEFVEVESPGAMSADAFIGWVADRIDATDVADRPSIAKLDPAEPVVLARPEPVAPRLRPPTVAPDTTDLPF